MTISGHSRTVDAVKGFAIVLVVYGHVAQGVHHRGWWNSPGYTFQERFIYSFHMAAFFFVSGLFVQPSLARSGAREFVLRRLRTVLWPYIVCVATSFVQFFVGPTAAAARHDFVRSVLVPVATGEASWFLPTLFLCLMLALVTDRLPHWATFASGLTLSLLWPATGIRIVDSAAHYFVVMTAGEWVNRRIERVDAAPRWAALAASVALFAALAGGNLSMAWNMRIAVVALGLAGTMGLFLLANAVRGSAIDNAACWCGEASLGIFVLHPFFQGAMRLVMAKATASHATFPNVAFPALVALIGPALLWHYRELLHIGFLFAFPVGAKRTAAPPADGTRPALARNEG